MIKKYARRKIKFYAMNVGQDSGGEPLPFDALTALKKIDTLAFEEGDNGRYHRDIDNNVLCGFPKDEFRGHAALQFCLIRREGLPLLERAGNVSDLNIDEAAGLMEASHVLFFADNVVGIEYNHFGPRPWRLADYLAEKAGSPDELMQILALIHPDVGGRLERLEDLRLAELTVKPSYTRTIRAIDESLADAFEANGNLSGDPDFVSVTLTQGARSRRAAWNRLGTVFRRIALLPDLNENARRVKVKGRDSASERVAVIDILSDRLAVERNIERMQGRSRAVDTDAAFDAICEAYDQIRDDIDLSFLAGP